MVQIKTKSSVNNEKVDQANKQYDRSKTNESEDIEALLEREMAENLVGVAADKKENQREETKNSSDSSSSGSSS